MKAILRVWWTFFAAFPIQRRLAIAGAVLCALFVSSGIVAQQAFWMLGPLAFYIFVVVPAVIASPGVFRALSAPRMHQLLPRFRLRMLGALGLLLSSVLVAVTAFAWGPQFVDRVPVSAFGYIDLALLAAVFLILPFVYLTSAFLVLFLASGDWRWGLAIPAAAIALNAVDQAARTELANASILWLSSAVIAWVVFAAWYLRARTIGPVAFTLRPKTSAPVPVDLHGPPGRKSAIRALVAARLPRSSPPVRSLAGVAGLAFGIVIISAALTPTLHTVPFTSAVWPLAFMGLAGAVAARIVHRSRVLWLKIPGGRQAVRREVERLLWRRWASSLFFLALVAAAYASPLGGATALEVLLGLALAAAAGLYGTYVAFAAVPSLAIQLWGFGLMIATQLALLSRAAPSPTIVIAITAAELLGALLLRALAIRRWETIDWLRVRPISGVAGVLQ